MTDLVKICNKALDYLEEVSIQTSSKFILKISFPKWDITIFLMTRNICKQLIQINSRKTSDPIKKWEKKTPKQLFLQRRHTDG